MINTNHDKILQHIFIHNDRLSRNYLKLIRNKKKYVNIKTYLINRYCDTSTENNKLLFKEVIYRIYKHVDNRIVCPICGKFTKFNEHNEYCYNYHCSKRCSQMDKNVYDKQNKTKLKKYGSKNNINKMKSTCITKYGVDNAAKSDIIKEKIKQTCVQKYGKPSSLQNEIVHQKTINTNIKKYGYEYPQQNETVKEKIKKSNQKTCLEKYGVNNIMQVKEILEKAQLTCLSKYGEKNITQTKLYHNHLVNEINDKRIETRRKNHTFNTSDPEEHSYHMIREKYPDVKRQYKSSTYPFACDFYIPSLDLYIECQYSWTHGNHPYNKDNKEDNAVVEKWKEKNTKFYNNAIETWTVRDVNKRTMAKENNLNFLEVWNINELKNWLLKISE